MHLFYNLIKVIGTMMIEREVTKVNSTYRNYVKVCDAELASAPASIKKLKPVIFKDFNVWCCLYGPNVHDGIFGYGKTPKEAFEDFDNDYKRFLAKEKGLIQ